MDMFRQFSPAAVLRIGLGLVYLYSGIGLIRSPLDWQGFLPQWFADLIARVMPLPAYLAAQGSGELILAAIFLLPFAPILLVRAAAFVSAFEFAAIAVFIGVDLVTFRDIGLLSAASALILLSLRR